MPSFLLYLCHFALFFCCLLRCLRLAVSTPAQKLRARIVATAITALAIADRATKVATVVRIGRINSKVLMPTSLTIAEKHTPSPSLKTPTTQPYSPSPILGIIPTPYLPASPTTRAHFTSIHNLAVAITLSPQKAALTPRPTILLLPTRASIATSPSSAASSSRIRHTLTPFQHLCIPYFNLNTLT